jgi:hypothetical protein
MRTTRIPANDLLGQREHLEDEHLKTAGELFADWYLQHAVHVRGASLVGPGPDWRLIRDAEASARERGMRASIPDPAAAGTPGYAADLVRWGDGRGINPDGPEPGGPEAGQ